MAVDSSITGHPDGVPFPSRRRLLIGGLGASIGLSIRCRQSGAVGIDDGTIPGSDQRLIEDCVVFDRLEIEIQGMPSEVVGEDTRSCDRLRAEQSVRLERIAGRRATTLAGIQRKARTLLSWAEDLLDPTDLWDRRLVGSILRDLRELAPGAVA